MATINYWGLTGVKGDITGLTLSTTTVDQLITSIATDEGLSTEYYHISLSTDPSKNDITYGDSSTKLDTMGFTDGCTVYCTPNQDGTKEFRQIQKLDIAQRKRTGGLAGDSTQGAYYRELNTYDRDSLPTKYSGNTLVDNANPTSLLAGRPWISSETPYLFSGLAIWYDTATASTINGGTFSDGTTLATLTNRATGTNAAPSSGREPTVQNGAGDTLNGYPVIRFATAGTYDAVTFSTTAFANATGWTVTTLAKLAYTVGFNPYIFEIANSSLATLNVVRYFAAAPGYFSVIGGASGSASVASSVDPDGTWKIVTVRYDSTAAAASRITFRWDKTARTVTNATTPSGAVASTADRINSMGAWNGDLAEQVAYNRALTDAEIISLEDYLSTKWGV